MAPPERSDVSRSDLRPKGVYYLVTIKRLAFAFTPRKHLYEQYQRVVNKTRGEWSSYIAYELDGLSRLHLHTIVTFTQAPYLKGIQRKGWTIHFQKFPKEDCAKVINYLTKVNQNPYYLDQLESESASYLSPYPFVEE